jgi:hypothetical protein
MRVEFPAAPHAAPWKTLPAQFITYLTRNSVQPNGATSSGPGIYRLVLTFLDELARAQPVNFEA